MAVQTGEGTIEIIYGTTSIPAGAATLGGYLARPDGFGEWPTVLAFGPEPTPTSTVKNICRFIARHGIAALAPDLTVDRGTNVRIASQVSAFMTDPKGHWSNAQFGYGVLSFGPGIYDATAHAADDGRVAAMVAIASTLDEVVTDALSVADIPTLFIGSRGDESSDIEASIEARSLIPLTTYVVYPDAPQGWWNDAAEGYTANRASDTFDRVVTFFADQLPPRT